MTEPLISIIVPVYNVENYIRQCIDSIIGQTYKNLEIILVDDGSPDNCPAICDEYAVLDSRIKVIHKPNGGQSSARNMALDICTGDYIAFVDSDDWVDTNAYSEIMDFMISENLDVVYCVPREITNDEVTGSRYHYYPDRTIFGAHDIAIRTLKNEISAEPWLKLCHRRCWEGIRFPEGRIYEDVAIAFYPLIKAQNKVGFLDRELYNYRINYSGTTQSRKPIARYHFFLALKERYEYAVASEPTAVEAAIGHAARFAMGTYLDYHCFGWAELEPYLNEVETFLEKNKVALLNNTSMPESEKLSLIMYYFSKRGFVAAYKCYIKLRGER